MSHVTIRVEELSKRYRRNLPTGEDRLGEVVTAAARKLLALPGRVRDQLRRPAGAAGSGTPADRPGEFWALRDVSFEVRGGEVFGIVGRNGAGKSTLLKVLSRITEPTAGRFGLAGRVGSLLEVGTGFHPELSGRENVFLNGVLLGMSRAEVRRKFDSIVGFAEIDDFLDTPVKRYSSGMQARLGFAVAAHLEPEVLIVDEVLAVGDANFQQKCAKKIREISARDGCTVLLVNHNLHAIRTMCARAVWLDRGRLRAAGAADAVAAAYEADCGLTAAP
jgi:lipopolysaccharide transport system ATP-binding protein